MGLEAESPRATFYIWSTIRKGFTSQDFCFKVLDAVNVWMIPGSMYGKYGEGYLRIALTHPVNRLQKAMDRLKKFMSLKSKYIKTLGENFRPMVI